MSENIGPRIALEGEAEFKRAIAAINTSLTTMGTEMRAVTSAYERNDKSAENLTAQNQVLTRQIEAQRQKLSELNAMLARARAEYGENDAQTQRYQQDVNRATAALNTMERQLRNNEAALSAAGNETDDLSDSFDSAGSSAITFGDVLKANILADAIVSGIRRLASGMKDFAVSAVESAAEVKAEWSQFAQTFGEFSGEATAAIQRVAEESGILSTRLNSTGSAIYAFARSSGAETQEAMSLMETALVAAADSAAYYDKSLEETTDSLMSFLKGNFANDAALGVSATETTRNAKAMELFGQKYSNLTEIQKQQTLLQMVVDAQELSGAMGQAARESDGYENVMGNLNETMRQFKANVGTPLLEALIPVIQEITARFMEWQESFDWEGFTQSIASFVSLVMDHGTEIISILAGIAAGFVAFNVASMIQGVAAAFTATTTATEGAAVAQRTLNTAMAANPIGIVITVVAALVTALVVLWNTNEDFRNAVIGIWTNIKDFFQTTISAIAGFFTETIPTKLTEVVGWFDELPGRISEAIQAKVTEIMNIGKNIVKGIWEGIKAMGDWLKDKVGGFFTGIVDGAKSLLGIASPSKVFADIGENMAAGLGIGFTSEMQGIARQINDSIPTTFSPQVTATARLGEGIVNGISGIMGGGFSGTILLQTVLDGRVIAQSTFDPLRDISRQRGVGLG